MTLKFGIFDHLDQRAEEALALTYADRIRLVQAAEQAGFRNYHLAEHHGTPLGMAPSPNLFLAALATHTSRIRLGPLVYIAPAYPPIRLLEEICMLDHLSQGRLEFGMGRGISPVEVAYCGLDAGATLEMLLEAEAIICSGLDTARLSYHGRYFHYDDVPLSIRPRQQPVPMWSAARSVAGQQLAARRGMHSVSLGATDTVRDLSASYRARWEENRQQRPAGSPVEPLIGAYRLLHVHADAGRGSALAEQAFNDWRWKLEKLWKENNISTPFQQVLGSFAIARQCGMMVCGTAQEVSDELQRQRGLTGVNYFALQIAFGDLGHSEEMRSLELFASRVMPELVAI